MRVVFCLRSIGALDIVENIDSRVIWLRKQRNYSPFKMSEISKITEMSREGSGVIPKFAYMGLNIDKVLFIDLSL